MMKSIPYRGLCTEFYDLDKPAAPQDALECYLKYAKQAKGPLLEPMCGSGLFLIPLLEQGFDVTGFDYSPHMLNACRKKCQEKGLHAALQEATFETFTTDIKYDLIFIPSGSFGLLTKPDYALSLIANKLTPTGKFVFEIETLNFIRQPQGVWRGRWVDRPDGSKIVMSVLSRFDPALRIETGLFRYELWEGNTIATTEVEEFNVRHYEPAEIEQLLKQHGLKVIGKWEAEPHSGREASDTSEVILYECELNVIL